MDPVIDSPSNVSPANWLALVAIIRDNYARYDGSSCCTAPTRCPTPRRPPVSMLENLGQPRRLHRQPDSDRRAAPTGAKPDDGHQSLRRASTAAPPFPKCRSISRTVCSAPSRTTKAQCEDLSAFWSYNYPPLADVGRQYHLPPPNTFSGRRLLTPASPRPPERRYRRRQALPGIEERTLRDALGQGLRGVVLENLRRRKRPDQRMVHPRARRGDRPGTDRPQRHAVPGRSGHRWNSTKRDSACSGSACSAATT